MQPGPAIEKPARAYRGSSMGTGSIRAALSALPMAAPALFGENGMARAGSVKI